MTDIPFARWYLPCPECGDTDEGAHRVDHLKAGAQFGPWYCDACGYGYRGRIVAWHAEGGPEVVTEPHTDRKESRLIVLRVPPEAVGAELHVEGMRFVNAATREERDSNAAYFYDEHTCPTNYMGNVFKIVAPDGDTDPHGIFPFVREDVMPRDDEAP